MKILLTTIVDNINYGTYLQAYATVKLLEEYGHDITVLNYIRHHLTFRGIVSDKKPKNLKNIIISALMGCLNTCMRWNLKRFLCSRVDMTSSFTDIKKIAGRLEKYDLYMTGSDQVWNTKHNHGVDKNYFFGGIKGKKCSYAASIGLDSFPKEVREEVRMLLNDYSMISVRESFGVDALKQLGIENAYQVLDPTLMFGIDFWRKETKKKLSVCEPYLLVYSVEVNRDKETLDIARRIAAEKGLKIYLISPYVKFNSRLNVDRLFSMADTETFLTLFQNASYAVVSSFHGTAFAINFNIPFVTVSPDKFSSRVKSILKLVNLENRYIKSIEDIPKDEIDFKLVNSVIEGERKNSRNILTELLNI